MPIAKLKDLDTQTGNRVNALAFTFSDLIAGYVTHFNRAAKAFGLRTSDGRDFEASLTPSTFARIAQNLEEPYQDCTARIGEMLEDGQYVFAYGVFYPTSDGTRFRSTSASTARSCTWAEPSAVTISRRRIRSPAWCTDLRRRTC